MKAIREHRKLAEHGRLALCMQLILRIGLLSPLAICSAYGQVSVLTQHNDIGRTGQNVKETLLSPKGVSATTFGKLFTRSVDGPIYAQPLYLPNVTVPTKGTHNVVFVATENDSVYAFDADSNGGNSGVPLWVANLATTAHGALPGATSVPSIDVGEDIAPTIGITGTPVIDPVSGTLFVVGFTKEKSNYILRLHALKVTSGQEQRGSPVVIAARAPGTGNGSSGGVVTFDAKWENQRPGLLLLNGVVYLGFAAHGDAGPWHGWLLSYDATSLKQLSAYCASPNGVGAGFWMSGAGLAADTDGAGADSSARLFLVTGNGDFNATGPNQMSSDYGDSILQLAPQKNVLTLGDSFTPSDQSYLDNADGDLGAGGALVIPDADSATHLLLQSGKEGKIYLLDRENLGSYHNPDQVIQEISNGTTSTKWGAGVWGIPAYWNKRIYFPGRDAPLQLFTLKNGLLSSTPASKTKEVMSYPAPTPSISANGTSDGIVWLLETANTTAAGAVLEAYDATNLQTLLYSSLTNADRDGLGTAVKFAVPTVANGKVYAASTSTDAATGAVTGQMNVFGLLSGISYAKPPVFAPGSSSFGESLTVTITDDTPGTAIYYTTDGSPPTAVSSRYTKQLNVTSNQTITAIASAPGYLESPATSATYTSSDQVPDPTISAGTGRYTNKVSITLADSLKSASMYYTTDGTNPTSQSTLYKKSFSLTVPDTTTVTFKVIALASGLNASNVVSRQYQITVEGTRIDFSSGFANAEGTMSLNGNTALDDTRLQLTSGGLNQASSAFVATPVQVKAFTTDFSFQLSNPVASGFTFTLQGIGSKALGSSGSGLGFAGINDSVALKFDFANDAGEGSDSTGVYVNGASPTTPYVDLTKTGIKLTSDDTFDAHLVYQNDTLDVTLTDIVTGATWSAAFAVDIEAAVAGQVAYAGFTGSSSAKGSSSQKIETWTYTSGTPTTPVTATPTYSLPAGNYASSQKVTIAVATSGAKIYYTTDGTNPSTSSTLYSAPITVNSTQTIQSIAVASGQLLSSVAAITYTIGN